MITQEESDMLGQLRDIAESTNSQDHPFIKHLPELVFPFGPLHISISHALTFAKLALKQEKPPMMTDALTILNQLIAPVDGSLIKPRPTMFFDNRNFFWNALGDRKDSTDVILHIFNKVFFTLSLG